MNSDFEITRKSDGANQDKRTTKRELSDTGREILKQLREADPKPGAPPVTNEMYSGHFGALADGSSVELDNILKWVGTLCRKPSPPGAKEIAYLRGLCETWDAAGRPLLLVAAAPILSAQEQAEIRAAQIVLQAELHTRPAMQANEAVRCLTRIIMRLAYDQLPPQEKASFLDIGAGS